MEWLDPSQPGGPTKEEVKAQLKKFEVQMNRFEKCWNEMHPGITMDRWWDKTLDR